MKAKTKLTKLWSILLALVMVVGMLPTVALAEGSATADFTSGDGSAALDLLNAVKTGDTLSTWDNSNKTLTLNGVNFETTAVIALKLPAGAKIVVNGANIIKGGNTGVDSCYGIYGVGNLTIQGTGTLNVTCAEADSSYGIRVEGNLTITDSTVTATGGTANSSSYGIYTDGSLTISDDADVTANGGQATNDRSYGIYAITGLTISGDNTVVTATGGTASRSKGIFVYSNYVTILSGQVEATGGTAGLESYGIDSYKMNIEGGTVTAKGGAAPGGDSYGICADQTLTISDGTTSVTATGGEALSSCGIRVKGNLAITDSTVTATGGTANSNSYGIYTDGSLTISDDADVTATGGSAGYDSSGIEATNDLSISGTATVTAKSGAAGTFSYGISVFNTMSISGTAKVKATGDTATNGSCGIYAYIGLTISGTADVTANGGTATNSSSYGIYSYNRTEISGGTVNANGGTATNNSYGIYTNNYDVNIAGGTVTAKAGAAQTASALSKAPSISISPNYWWRTSASGQYKKGDFNWGDVSTYVEIRDTAPAATTYKVSFDANGGSGTMADVSGLLGDYTLPANGFTAPAGKRFKCWSVDGAEKAVGDKITVSANTTVKAVWETIVTAVWETIPATSTEYDILDGANSSWTQNSAGSLSIRGSGAFSEFVGVKVDGKSVDEQYYTVKEGSTIVTLKAEYLSTLAAGPHTIQLIWKDGTASTTFNINVNNPNTGDNGGLALAAALLALSAAAIATSGFNRKRGKSSR